MIVLQKDVRSADQTFSPERLQLCVIYKPLNLVRALSKPKNSEKVIICMFRELNKDLDSIEINPYLFLLKSPRSENLKVSRRT